MSLFAELKRRNVFKVGAAYLVVGWLTIEVASTIAPHLNLPEWAPRLVTFLVLLGFPLALVLSWIFDLTPEGVQVTPGSVGNRRFYAVVGVIAVAAIAWVIHDSRPGTSTIAEEVEAPASTPSIAVLPFTDLSPGNDQGYFADGIAEEILNLLARNPALRVVARTSAFQFREAADLREVGAALDATRILEGSVRTAGTRVRITAQLIDTETGLHLWSDTYDRDLTDIFKVQDEIAGAIAEELGVRLGGVRPAPDARPDTDAYHVYLRGRKALNERNTPGRFDEGVALLEQAVGLDPALAGAHGALALAYSLGPWFNDMSAAESLSKALAASDAAMELDPDNVEAMIGRGYALAIRGLRVADGERLLQRALELSPNDITAVNLMGDVALLTGDRTAAFELETRAAALDPLESIHQVDLAFVYQADRNWERSLAHARRAYALEPLNRRSPAVEVIALVFLGEVAAAQARYDEAVASGRYLWSERFDACLLRFVSGDAERFTECSNRIDEAYRRGEASATAPAYVSYLAGDFAKAAEMIRESVEREGSLWAFSPFAMDLHLDLARAGHAIRLPGVYDELVARWSESPWANRPPLRDELIRIRDRAAHR